MNIPAASIVVSLSRIVAVAVAGIASAVMLGYAIHDDRIVTVMPGLQGMSVVTAFALLTMAVSILAESDVRFRASAVPLSVGVSVLTCVMFVARAVIGEDVVSPAIASHLFGFDAAHAGRTSLATASCLALLGLAGATRRHARLADGAAGIAVAISGIALLGYCYGVSDLYAVPVFNTMALHTAVAIFVLCFASLAVRPGSGWAAIVAAPEAGGSATRRQLAFTLLPPVAGWLLLRSGDAHQLGPAAAMAMLVVLTVLPLSLLILRDGRMLTALEAEKRAKAALRQESHSELERQLSRQAAELQAESAERSRAESALYHAQRIEAMGQLTGGIAHDFNNLLMAVGGNLQLMLGRLPDHDRNRRYAENALAATERGTKLTRQLLAFSRKQQLDIRPAELDPIILNTRAMIGTSLGSAINIELRPNAAGLWAKTDPDQLELAILNLALNARDAMPDGGDLVIASGTCRARLGDAADEALYLSITVTDTGAGMSAEVAAQAVEPFFTTKERGKGTGLGLAQVYGFVRQCQGDLRITSEPGRGTTIELLLPDAKDRRIVIARTPLPIKKPTSPTMEGQETLLVIDDDDSVRPVLIEILTDGGYAVVEARDGAEGLRLLDDCTPAAAIIDFHMPGLNGVETARRAITRYPDLPIIFVSGHFDAKALDAVPGAVLVRKPFNAEYLQRTVASLLQRGKHRIH